MTTRTFQRIAEDVQASDLPSKEQKLGGLRAAYHKRHRRDLRGDMFLLDGIATDPSELENGYWL